MSNRKNAPPPHCQDMALHDHHCVYSEVQMDDDALSLAYFLPDISDVGGGNDCRHLQLQTTIGPMPVLCCLTVVTLLIRAFYQALQMYCCDLQ